MPIIYINPVFDGDVRILCLHPYPNHPKGCPNFGEKETCPPKAPLFQNVFDISKPVLAVWQSFNLQIHREKMREKHPDWSKRQLDCCLYWQNRVTKKLKRDVEYNLTRYALFGGEKNLAATYCPEGMNVNVTATMKNAGIELEWPPENTVIKVAFIGVKRNVR